MADTQVQVLMFNCLSSKRTVCVHDWDTLWIRETQHMQ